MILHIQHIYDMIDRSVGYIDYILRIEHKDDVNTSPYTNKIGMEVIEYDEFPTYQMFSRSRVKLPIPAPINDANICFRNDEVFG